MRRALYEVLLAPDVAKSTKSAMFLSLLYKAMKADISDKRIIAFTKRILQVCSSSAVQLEAAGRASGVAHRFVTWVPPVYLQVAVEQLPNFACGCLLLVSELLKVRRASTGSIVAHIVPAEC